MKTLRPLLIAFLTYGSSFAQFTDDMNFTDINGNTINPSTLLNEGKHIYLDFFSTSCGTCNSVASEVVSAYHHFGSNTGNVYFVGVDYYSSPSACENFANQHNSNFPIISGQQQGNEIFNLFEQYSYPAGRLISPNGDSDATFTLDQIVTLTESLAAYVSPTDNCDLIEIQSMEVNQTGNLVLDIFTSTSFGPYPYFILLNLNGDTLAQEQIFYFGLSEASTHNLLLLSDPTSWDSELILNLYEGMNNNLQCTIEISSNAIEINGCMDTNAANFNPQATQDDGSCLYSLTACGSITIAIDAGWNIVGFSCRENRAADVALAPYIDQLIIAKDYLGAAYLPEWNFNGIGSLERGFGYQLKIAQPINEFNLCSP